MPIDFSILGGIALPQVRDPQQEAVQRLQMQTAQLNQQRIQQELRDKQFAEQETAASNDAMNQAWGFVQQYMDPDTGIISIERVPEIMQQAGISAKYAPIVLNMIKTMNADVAAQRKSDADAQKLSQEVADKRQASTDRFLASTANELLAIDDLGTRNVAFLANMGRLIANKQLSHGDASQIVLAISNPDGSINSERMTKVLENVVMRDKDIAAAREVRLKREQPTYGAETTWVLVNGTPTLARTASDGRLSDPFGTPITGTIAPMPTEITPYQQQQLMLERERVQLERQRLQAAASDATTKAQSLPSAAQAKVTELLELNDAVNRAIETGNEAKWQGTGIISGRVGAAQKEWFGWGSNTENAHRLALNSLLGLINKIRNGATFTAGERQLLESYIPTPNESSESIQDKLRGVQAWLNSRRDGTVAVEPASVDAFKTMRSAEITLPSRRRAPDPTKRPSKSPITLPGTWEPQK